MKSYLQLIWRYIKLQKRATCSLAVSIFLISCLLLSTSSFITINKAYKSITNKEQYGDFWYGFSEIDKDKAMKIKFNNYVEQSIVGKIEGYVTTNKKNERGNNLYIEVKNFEPELLKDTFNIKLEKGRFPEKENEIIIETKLFRMLEESDINQEIEFELLEYPIKSEIEKNKVEKDESDNIYHGVEESSKLYEDIKIKGNKKYKIVGIYSENTFQDTRPLIYSRVIGYLDEYTEGDYEVYVKKARKYISPKALMTGAFNVIDGNYENTSAYKNIEVNSFKYVLFSTLLQGESEGGNIILLIILSIITIVLMYNSVNISIIEKRNDILLLYKVGASLRQIKYLIVGEILTISLVAQAVSFFILIITNEWAYKVIGIEEFSVFCRRANIQIAILFSVILFILILIVAAIYFFNKSIERILYTYEEFECESQLVRGNIEKSISKRLIEQNYRRFFKCTITIGISIGLVVLFINQLIMYKNKLNSVMEQDVWDIIYNRVEGHISTKEYNELIEMKEVDKVYRSNNIKVIAPVLETNVSKMVRSPDNMSKGDILSYKDYIFLDIRVREISQEQLDIYNKSNNLNVTLNDLNENGALIYNSMNYSNDMDTYKDNKKSEPLDIGDEIIIPTNDKTYNTALYDDITSDLYNVIDNKEYNRLNIKGVINKDIFTVRNIEEGKPSSLYYDMSYAHNENMVVYVSEDVFKQLFKEKYNDQLLIKINNTNNKIEEIALAKGDFIINYIEKIETLKENCEKEAFLNISFSGVLVLISVINILNTIVSTIQLRKKVLSLLMAVGMDSDSVKKMIYYETFILINSSLVIGLPVTVGSTLGSQLGLIKSGTIYIHIWIISILIAVSMIYVVTFLGITLFLRKISDIKILNCIAEKE